MVDPGFSAEELAGIDFRAMDGAALRATHCRLAAEFSAHAHRTEGACQLSSLLSAVGNGIPITKPRGAISTTPLPAFSVPAELISSESAVN